MLARRDAGALAPILALERFERVPGVLLAVVIATAAVALLDLDADGVAVMGEVPQGLPAFAVPWLSGVDLVHIVIGGVAVALRGAGIELHFAEMKDPVRDKIRQFELTGEFPADCLHPTVGAAVDDYLADHGVDWTP